MPEKIFSKSVIVGLGLIGGSIGKAIVKNKLCDEVWGTDISTPVLIRGQNCGAITHYSDDLATVFKDAELIILAVPVDKIISVLETILPYIETGAIVTDTGSVKEKIVAKAVALLQDKAEFIGGHPMAGSEKEGIDAAMAEILIGHTYIFTPHQPLKNYQNLGRLLKLIDSIGMKPAFLPPDKHDNIVANISHLPHVIAAILMTAVGTKCSPEEMKNFTGNGFKDTTRISAGSPELWSQILSLNRANILNGLEKFQVALKVFQDLLQNNDVPSLKAFLAHASFLRNRLSTEEENHDSKNNSEEN